MAIVTAGLRGASLSGDDATTPTKTARAQPRVMTIQPELFPLVPLRSTLATTPSPKRTSKAVPINSPKNGFMMISSGDRDGFITPPLLWPARELMRAVNDSRAPRFRANFCARVIALGQRFHKCVGSVFFDEVDGGAAKATPRQTRPVTAGDFPREVHKRVEFRNAVLEKIPRTFVALEKELAEL